MGDLKARMLSLDPRAYTPREAAEHLGTSVWTVYSLSARYNINFKKAGYGVDKGIKKTMARIDTKPKA